jgi:hypothetical protein
VSLGPLLLLGGAAVGLALYLQPRDTAREVEAVRKEAKRQGAANAIALGACTAGAAAAGLGPAAGLACSAVMPFVPGVAKGVGKVGLTAAKLTARGAVGGAKLTGRGVKKGAKKLGRLVGLRGIGDPQLDAYATRAQLAPSARGRRGRGFVSPHDSLASYARAVAGGCGRRGCTGC